MSYILDALKRADAERERGHVPGLHAQPLPGAAGTTAGLPRWGLWAGGAVGLVVVAALAWRMGADAHAPVPVTLGTPPAAPTAEPVVAAPPAPTPALAPANEPVALAPVTAPRVSTPPTTAAAQTAPATAPRPAPAAEPSTPPAAAPANAAIPLYAQLPAGTRQQMPSLAVTGSVYSDDASARFIMLNGDVAKEGSQPVPGLVVERIEPKSAVLRYKGERFRLPY